MTDTYLGRAYPAVGLTAQDPRNPACAQDAKPAGSGSLTGLQSHTPVPADSLTLLIAALHEQTAAINRLAASNEMLVQAMSEGGDMGDDVPPTQYLDGSPVR